MKLEPHSSGYTEERGTRVRRSFRLNSRRCWIRSDGVRQIASVRVLNRPVLIRSPRLDQSKRTWQPVTWTWSGLERIVIELFVVVWSRPCASESLSILDDNEIGVYLYLSSRWTGVNVK